MTSCFWYSVDKVILEKFSSQNQATAFIDQCYQAAEAKLVPTIDREDTLARELVWGYAMLAAEEMFNTVYTKYTEMKQIQSMK